MMGNIMKNKIIKYIKRTKLGIVYRNIMKYDQSSQYLNQTTKQSYNPNLTGV